MKISAEKKEVFPLSWPSDWPRTRPQDQKSMAAWKRTANDYREDLAKEMDRIHAPIAIISTNVPLTVRGTFERGIEPRDVGVAIYFSQPTKEEFRWQDALSLHTPAPTEEEIQAAYRRLAARHHPDKGGDIEMFRALTQHRDHALRWATRATATPDEVIACDLFREVRLNLAGIAFTLKALRQIARCGTSPILARAFTGFMALAADAGPDAEGR